MVDPETRRSQMGLGLQEDVGIPVAPDTGFVVETAPTKEPTTPGEWIRVNLFSGPFNSILTVLSSAFVIFIVYKALRFVFVTSEWAVLQANMRGYMVGRFPLEETWRVWACLYLGLVLAGLSLGASRITWRVTPRRVVLAAVIGLAGLGLFFFLVQTGLVRLLGLGALAALAVAFAGGRALRGRIPRRPLFIAWLLVFPVMMVIIRGFDGVPPDDWGGFFFNLTAATVGIFASFPIGIALALGRRSELPAARLISVVVIELFRGVPLVGWLIFSKFVVDLLLPPQWDLPDIIKAFIAMTMFSSAYVAEIVRGGLQGVHEGQFEASRAIGLSTPRMMAFVVLPQALRSTIPAMISHFISLFKDTSLFVAIEVTDLLAAAFRSAASIEFLQTEAQTLALAALLFWSVAFSMSRWSQRLELRLGVGER
ncbi:MAG: amino acid ABC transporter permease [Actinomycetota bacterium]|nr:amino acid ABC transporter permease [Actinomycetota bacterium]